MTAFRDLFAEDDDQQRNEIPLRSAMNWTASALQPTPEQVRTVEVDVARNISWRLAILMRIPMDAWPAMMERVPESMRAETQQFLKESEGRKRASEVIKRYSPPMQKGVDCGPVSASVNARLKTLSM